LERQVAPAARTMLKVVLSPGAAAARGSMPLKPATAVTATARNVLFIQFSFSRCAFEFP
jgi:hypothetical protein